MIKLNEVQENLLNSLKIYILVALRPNSTKDRSYEWNEIVSLYGTRVIESLKNIDHHAYLCRLMNVDVRDGVPIDQGEYDKHLIWARSLAHECAEDW